jgi:hypothetical protein
MYRKVDRRKDGEPIREENSNDPLTEKPTTIGSLGPERTDAAVGRKRLMVQT